jgi:alpha-tubulin suppressor-like RCC1 family protein
VRTRQSILMPILLLCVRLAAAEDPAVTLGPPWRSIVAGDQYTVGLKTDGTVWAWGNDRLGQLGDGTTAVRDRPVQVQGLPPAAMVAAGGVNSAAVAIDGTIWIWGRDDQGQLGAGYQADRLVPSPAVP